NLGEPLGLFRRDAAPETQEHLEGRLAGAVEELKAERLLAVEMARLLHGEDRPYLIPADVHVQGVRLDVEKSTRRAETTELAVSLQSGRSVGDDDMHLAERLQAPDQFFPAPGVKLNGSVVGKGPNNLDLRHAELPGQKHGHLVGVFP